MRIKHAKKNVIYGITTYVFLMVLSFINRRIFVDTLGQEMVGLQNVLQSTMSLLNLVESGVGMAVMFSLYKPFAENDKVQIKSIVSLYSRLYKIFGTVIFFVGILLSGFLGFFVKEQIPIDYARMCLFIYLVDTALTYYFSYKTCMLYASQDGYIISFWDFIFKTVRSAIQIVILIKFKSFILFIAIQVLTNIMYLTTINLVVNKKFPWLKTVGVEEIKGKTDIIKNVKVLFIHKIGSFVVFSTDSLIITHFLGLVATGLYGNYNMVITFCDQFMRKIFDGLTASIGNLLTEGDEKKSFDIYRKLFFFNFWMSSFVSICLYNLMDSFVMIWLGKKSLLPKGVLIVLILNFFLTTMRLSIDKFKESGGMYYEDRYAPLFEVTINLVFSIILVQKMGLAGVFLGTLISNLSVIFWVKPKIVFNKVFKKSFIEYLTHYIKYVCCGIIPFILTSAAGRLIQFNSSILQFLVSTMVNVVLINGTYLILFHRTEEFKYYKKLVFKK